MMMCSKNLGSGFCQNFATWDSNYCPEHKEEERMRTRNNNEKNHMYPNAASVDELHQTIADLRKELNNKTAEFDSVKQTLDLLRCDLNASRSEFKNFHRMLCDRFEYGHDETHWPMDQISLIEHIASQIPKKRNVEEDLKKLAKAFFNNLMETNGLGRGIGLDDKRPFGNSYYISDILKIIGMEIPEDENWTKEQQEYARDLYHNKLIPYLNEQWAKQ